MEPAKSNYKYWDNYPEFYAEGHGPHSRPLGLYILAKKEYYRGTPIMSDATFDAFEIAIRNKYPDCPLLNIVGAPTAKDVDDLFDWCAKKREEERQTWT
jgi:hypothetical protein